ncbi:efflux RND transporter permease subunit [Thiorhodococcus mannitoliphagus]|uniref:Efflux RND transporter permease subunit n=1 Tax=Thiorhodococcus mannitoliphagus TaxID=329406 RepID=A0A6P1DZ00_9GAMM|nr:efflux RND transporter permease subunit [Thiorhodococcus mannitoliphagus]NEX22909.1 efflux RND transporter permease subunit [Thiorhodococcus mannitoliphagus]
MFKKLIRNHVLTNLTFGLVLVLGSIAYLNLPREQDPSVNFNWVAITTIWAGASAEDVEQRITDLLEDGIQKVDDIKFVNSTSRQGVSIIMLRFMDISPDTFAKRMDDLRREVQTQQREMPQEATEPEIIEISSANLFPTATLSVIGLADDEVLRRTAVNVRKDIQRISGVDRVDTIGEYDPELHVDFSPERLVGLGLSPVALADTVNAYFRNLAAGSVQVGNQKWFVRLEGTSEDPRYLEAIPVVTAIGELPLRSVADIVRSRQEAEELVRFEEHPAVMLSIFKSDATNNLKLLSDIRAYMTEQNPVLATQGIRLTLIEDQTLQTRHAIEVMENNALVGLILVVFSVGIFLGLRVAILTSIGIPFALAGVFLCLALFGQTLNSTTLLAIVISLGMLVDDAVVVVEAIYQKLLEGYEAVEAAMAGLREVGVPVVAAVLTTIAAFLPLMLIPGVLGDYMKYVPAVVTLALLISLVEAFWILPSHMIKARVNPRRPGRIQAIRNRWIQAFRRYYARLLVKVLRWRRTAFGVGIALLAGAVLVVVSGAVRVDYFATDLYRLFYVGVEMPPGTKAEKTLEVLAEIEDRVRAHLRPDEAEAIIRYAGQRVTAQEPLYGEEKGQVFVSLKPAGPDRRNVNVIIDEVRDALQGIAGPLEIVFLTRKLGPPTQKPISVKVRGNDITAIRAAARALKGFLNTTDGVIDIADDDTLGRMELKLHLNPDAIVRAGLSPADVVRIVRLYADGEVVASMQNQGERLVVRVRTQPRAMLDTQSFLDYPVGLPDGSEIALGNLVDSESGHTISNIRHFDFRRAITIEADIDSARTDTITATKAIEAFWAKNAARFPGIALDLSGQNDDIQESLGAIIGLFVVGLGLIYLILGTQFVSYQQPFLVLSAVPMAFIGVVMGLIVSGNPLSLYTLYGIVALAGISANDAIVLISTANRYNKHGFSVSRSIVSAARRRVVPILITSVTTIAGLFSLATGLAGESLMWGPVATSIVWGLMFSTLLTLFLIPATYLVVTRPPLTPVQKLQYLPLLVARTPSSLQKWLSRFRGQPVRDTVSEEAIADVAQRAAYRDALDALERGELEKAIRGFQHLSDQNIGSLLFSLATAQALLLYVHKIGWDSGYMERTRRYLARARALDPQSPRLLELEQAYRVMDQPIEGR